MENKDSNNENVHTYDNGHYPKEVILKENYAFYNRSFLFKFAAKTILYLTRFWIFFAKLLMGIRVKGRKNKYKVKGAIIISNHIHPLDAFISASNFYFRKVYVTMLQSNLGFGFVSRYMRLAAAVPIPTERRQLRRFNKETADALKRGDNILFYPEAALVPYCDHIRNFLPGAFHFAVVNNAPIIPCCFTFHKPKGIRKLFSKKPVIRLTILEPYFISDTGNRNETIEKAKNDVHKIMSDFFLEHSDFYYPKNN